MTKARPSSAARSTPRAISSPTTLPMDPPTKA
jgi:hypothetical protein